MIHAGYKHPESTWIQRAILKNAQIETRMYWHLLRRHPSCAPCMETVETAGSVKRPCTLDAHGSDDFYRVCVGIV